jgi:hypothetical protein
MWMNSYAVLASETPTYVTAIDGRTTTSWLVISVASAFTEKEVDDPSGCTMWEIFSERRAQVMLLVPGRAHQRHLSADH